MVYRHRKRSTVLYDCKLHKHPIGIDSKTQLGTCAYTYIKQLSSSNCLFNAFHYIQIIDYTIRKKIFFFVSGFT